MRNVKLRGAPWTWIVIAFVIFWPIGMFLLIKKIAIERGTALTCSKSVTNLSYVLFGLAVVYMLMALTGNMHFVVAGAMCIIGGYVMHLYANKSKVTSGKYKKYIDLVVNHRQTSIDNIAVAVGVTYSAAVFDLQKMISSGYFTGTRIDHSNRAIIMNAPQFGSDPFAKSSKREQDRVASCESCGANNVVTSGRLPECEYCGSPL